MTRSFWLAIGILLASASPGWAQAATAIDGGDRALIRPPRGVFVEPYANESYRLERRGPLLEVSVSTDPLESIEPFRLPVRRGGAIETVARATTAGAETRYEAVTRVLSWVQRNVEYDLDREASQASIEVLERRSAYCTGFARLSVALLNALEIPAREVAGYVISTPEEQGGFHRWIEVYYPDRGWVFSDPVRSHHYVPATYLRLASSEVVESELDEGVVVERRDEIFPVDLFPGASEGVRVRRNRANQFAGTVHVQIEGRYEGQAILEGSRGRRWSAHLGPKGSTFLGLEPGEYTLRVLLAGQSDLVRNLRLEGRVLSTVLLSAH